MSRAFVKEDSDAPPPPIPERPISTAQNFVTPRGARLIAGTIAQLKARLVSASAPDVDVIRRDLRYWLSRRASMQLVPRVEVPVVVGFGSCVAIQRGAVDSVVTIVGEDEADPSSGLIAWTAPLARALAGAQVGDTVELEAAGRREPIVVAGVTAGNSMP